MRYDCLHIGKHANVVRNNSGILVRNKVGFNTLDINPDRLFEYIAADRIKGPRTAALPRRRGRNRNMFDEVNGPAAAGVDLQDGRSRRWFAAGMPECAGSSNGADTGCSTRRTPPGEMETWSHETVVP